MKNNNYYSKFICTILAFCAIICTVYLLPSEPNRKTGVLPNSSAVIFDSDSTLYDGRQIGLVNFDKFVNLATQLGSPIFSAEQNVSYKKDSVTITLNTKKSNILFGDFTNFGELEQLQDKYKNFPITIINKGSGFTAELITKDSLRYIRIPYIVLASMANYVYENASDNTSNQQSQNNQRYDNTIDVDIINTLRQSEPGKEKIQVEGLVMRNFSDIQATENKQRSSDPATQLKIAWTYVKNHWLYVYDPAVEKDTWRSASETIANYYSNGKCYTGDCDDFAILMASFARQAGLQSHLVAVFKGNGGHMYAEFRKDRNDRWHNLDWFDTFDSPNRYTGDRQEIIDNI